ncbi:hypothetical protein ACFL5V_06215 [Fibrobacterota bacterium]
MEKKKVLSVLRKESKNNLIQIIDEVYGLLSEPDIFKIFTPYYEKSFSKKSFVGRTVGDIEQFYKDSYAGEYYAPFDVNSKNFMHIPEETELWFDLLRDYLDKTVKLFEMEEYKLAADCFSKLFNVYNDMDRDIVFADELGGHLLHAEHKQIIPKFIRALAKTKDPQDYAKEILLLMRLDEYDYNMKKVYNFAKRIGSKEQKEALKKQAQKNQYYRREIGKF